MGEGVTPDLDILDTYVKATYPDLRKCINMVQMNAQEGQIDCSKHSRQVRRRLQIRNG